MLKTRVITAIALALGFLAAMFNTTGISWSLITLVITLIGVWEWAKLIKLHQQAIFIYIVLTLVLGLMLIFAPHTSLGHYVDETVFGLLVLASLFWLLCAPAWLILRKHLSQKWLMAALGLQLLLAVWVAINGLHHISPWLLLAVLGTVWLADCAAYFAGKQFGKHKLAPEISPGKTWEGVAGAIVAVTVYGLILCYYQHISRWLIVGLWLMVILSVMGDLFESLLKRQAQVKDSSHLLPGHGGVLDRIDGLMPVLPLVLFYIYFPLFANLQLHAR